MLSSDKTKLIGEADFKQLITTLDNRSRALLWHLRWQRHASISELRCVLDGITDWEILFRIKEVINRSSEALFGKPVAIFEESETDTLTGEKVSFSWWYCGCPITKNDLNEPLVDLFAGRDHATIIALLPGWQDDRKSDGTDIDDGHRIAVNLVSCKNGILQVELQKEDNRSCQR
jgi:hypothetical protein